MKVEKLTTTAQPIDWLREVTQECGEYPIHLVDIADDELVMDIGCNIGGFWNAWKHKFNNWVAVDASGFNCEEYERNTGMKPIHKAVFSKSKQKVQLQAYKGTDLADVNSGCFGITGFINGENGHGWQGDWEEVETISLADLVGKKEVGLLKVDIEGAEWDFLDGKDLSKIKYIVGEFHNFLFQFNDKGSSLLNWIGETHDEIWSSGDGNNSHYVKLFKRKEDVKRSTNNSTK